MPDPLTVLRLVSALLTARGGQPQRAQRLLGDRHQGESMTLDLSNLAEALKWEYAYQKCGSERAGVERTQFLYVIVCYEVVRPNSPYGFVSWRKA